MEHNILHGGIGISEALDVLSEFHDIAKPETSQPLHQNYFHNMRGGAKKKSNDENVKRITYLLMITHTLLITPWYFTTLGF